MVMSGTKAIATLFVSIWTLMNMYARVLSNHIDRRKKGSRPVNKKGWIRMKSGCCVARDADNLSLLGESARVVFCDAR